MAKENLINLVNNKKPVELVQELKDYEIKKSPLSAAARSKVISKYGGNYVSENKGYGSYHSCGNKNLRFRLEIVLRAWDKAEIGGTVFSTDEAERVAQQIKNGEGHWEDKFLIGPFGETKRGRLASKIMMWIDIHKNGSSVNETVTVILMTTVL